MAGTPPSSRSAGGGGGLFDAYALLRDEKAAGTSGGQVGATGAWRTRTLNTEVFDSDGFVALAANQFTLDAGSYWIEASAPFYTTGRSTLKLRDITAGADAIIGGPVFATDGGNDETVAFLSGRISPAVTTVYELQYQVGAAPASTLTLGVEGNFGVVEVYASLAIFREA